MNFWCVQYLNPAVVGQRQDVAALFLLAGWDSAACSQAGSPYIPPARSNIDGLFLLFQRYSRGRVSFGGSFTANTKHSPVHLAPGQTPRRDDRMRGSLEESELGGWGVKVTVRSFAVLESLNFPMLLIYFWRSLCLLDSFSFSLGLLVIHNFTEY